MSESIQKEVLAAQEATQLRSEVVAEAETKLSTAAHAIPIHDAEAAEVEREVERTLDELRQVDIYSAEGDVSKAFGSIFSSADKRRAETQAVTSMLTKRNYQGMEDSKSFEAVNQLRDALEDYDPKKFNLTSTERFLGFIPMPGMLKGKLKRYARKMQTAESHINEIMDGVEATREDGIRAKTELNTLEKNLLTLSKGLRVDHLKFKRLDERIHEYLDELGERDPIKAQKIRDELIFQIKQERLDTVTILNFAVIGVEQVGVLKKTQDMVIAGCKRASTSGRLILTINQSIATTAHEQKRGADLLGAVNETINGMTTDTAKQIRDHSKQMRELTESPLAAVEALQAAFTDTYAATDELKNHLREAAKKAQSSIEALEGTLQKSDDRAKAEKDAIDALGKVINKASDRSAAPSSPSLSKPAGPQ